MSDMALLVVLSGICIRVRVGLKCQIWVFGVVLHVFFLLFMFYLMEKGKL